MNQPFYDVELLPWRNRPPSTVVFPKIFPRSTTDSEYPCPLQTEMKDSVIYIWNEEKDPIIKPGSEQLMWNPKTSRADFVLEAFSVNKQPAVYHGFDGVRKPTTLKEVLEYKKKN